MQRNEFVTTYETYSLDGYDKNDPVGSSTALNIDYVDDKYFNLKCPMSQIRNVDHIKLRDFTYKMNDVISTAQMSMRVKFVLAFSSGGYSDDRNRLFFMNITNPPYVSGTGWIILYKKYFNSPSIPDTTIKTTFYQQMESIARHKVDKFVETRFLRSIYEQHGLAADDRINIGQEKEFNNIVNDQYSPDAMVQSLERLKREYSAYVNDFITKYNASIDRDDADNIVLENTPTSAGSGTGYHFSNSAFIPTRERFGNDFLEYSYNATTKQLTLQALPLPIIMKGAPVIMQRWFNVFTLVPIIELTVNDSGLESIPHVVTYEPLKNLWNQINDRYYGKEEDFEKLDFNIPLWHYTDITSQWDITRTARSLMMEIRANIDTDDAIVSNGTTALSIFSETMRFTWLNPATGIAYVNRTIGINLGGSGGAQYTELVGWVLFNNIDVVGNTIRYIIDMNAYVGNYFHDLYLKSNMLYNSTKTLALNNESTASKQKKFKVNEKYIQCYFTNSASSVTPLSLDLISKLNTVTIGIEWYSQ